MIDYNRSSVATLLQVSHHCPRFVITSLGKRALLVLHFFGLYRVCCQVSVVCFLVPLVGSSWTSPSRFFSDVGSWLMSLSVVKC